MNDFFSQLPTGVATNLISDVIWILVVTVVAGFALYMRKRMIWWYVGSARRLGFAIAAAVGTLGACVHFGLLSLTTASIALSMTTAVVSMYLLYRFRKLGILDVFGSTVSGIDYARSLRKPRHSFDFLGVGAHKLTSSPEFRKMVVRCAKGGRPVRLLLSHPDNPVLRNIASRSGRERSAYAGRVKESLKLIADLAQKEGFNIVVKFYHAESQADFQQFRLVFIDERICLLSYTIWDDQEGRSNPQIVLHAGSDQTSKSMYYTFKDYFERIWSDDKTTLVDLTKYR